MKKNKIQIGQCYEKDDHIYTVIGKSRKYKGKWVIQNTLTKYFSAFPAKELQSWRRPFDNWG